jgi:hypothetical protein
MTRARTALVAAVLAAAPLLLAGCDSEAEAATEAAQKSLGTVQTVACPADAQAVDLPAGFTAPLPEGTVVVDVRSDDQGRTVVTGAVPAAEADVLRSLQAAYPAAGLTLTEGETEEHDAESNFTGPGIAGRWGIRELSDCAPAATRIDVVVRRA